ncbi:Splicing factor spf30 [Cyphellophora attinorum]|uniref:Splicing factor spf30 n=1 Tax=Cyphellophora attinorum TaxID=1664694 RepID=A0A0N1H202_9EURO|nr:Splicing factor spf30 [Phialophora attinorum]KPI35082.1 Splicing factor spf30 [Phialophora attinorum]
MASEIAAFENDIKEYRLQLETIQLGLQSDPDNTELQTLKAEIEDAIALLESEIANLRPAPVASKQSPTTFKEKWSRENHPAYQAGYKKPEAEVEDTQTPAAFSVNDTVTARWRSGDGGFYTARIQSITGSKNDPVYIVKFPKYGTVETLKSRDIKPLSVEAKKRKADGMSGSSTPTQAPVANTSVISAAASVDPTLAQQAKKEPSKVSDGPARPAKIPKKVKANKELEAGKGKWQDFVAKGKGGKMAKKDSMFRTGESFTARVGFTGSGHEMRKDVTRARHIYDKSDTLDGDGR